MKTRNRRTRLAYTLLELLVSMGLLVVLISMLWSLIQFYSNYYQSGIRRSDRSQVVRSLSQLLDDDLGAAIQDPIHPLPPSLVAEDTIRRFGLWGDSRSLRVDLIQINPLDPAEKKSVSRKASLGVVPAFTPQVPELKTVFYEFVPLSEDRSGNSEIRCGLTRQEINFETPVDHVPAETEAEPFGDDPENVPTVVRAVGSEVSPPESWNPDAERAPPAERENRYTNRIAERLFRETDDGSMWAPEVVACRFRYCDGANWVDSWDSLQRNGLPTAVEVTLKLMPLDEVETLRLSAGTLRENTTTLESLARQLELTQPFEQRIVTYLATSPLLKSEPITRPRPPSKTSATPQSSGRPGISLPKPEPFPPASPSVAPPAVPGKTPGQQWIRG